jgi:hypothetical protein
MAKCKREHRRAWVINAGGRYGGLCIVKDEFPNDYGISGKVLKICSFKIAEGHRGNRYGELLLKTIFAYLVENQYDRAFVEILSKHTELCTLLAEFGFEDLRASPKGERVLVKQMHPADGDLSPLAPLAYNVKYGPHAVTLANVRIFVVPIRPRYHSMLFPELDEQLVLLPTTGQPYGNSVRKAYLSHSKIRKISPGDAILFYRSEVDPGVTVLGVAEQTLVSTDPLEIARFVGKRTVYSYAEIEQMTAKPVLAVLFRMARTLKPSWNVDLLKRAGIIKRPPQSFMQVSGDGATWIATQLNVPR